MHHDLYTLSIWCQWNMMVQHFLIKWFSPTPAKARWPKPIRPHSFSFQFLQTGFQLLCILDLHEIRCICYFSDEPYITLVSRDTPLQSVPLITWIRNPMELEFIIVMWYCWWRKSYTTWDLQNPVNNGINYLSTGAGFLPSTVFPLLLITIITTCQ